MGICDGRVVIVTGSGRGIGREHALAYAAEGAKLVVNDRLREYVQERLSGQVHRDEALSLVARNAREVAEAAVVAVLLLDERSATLTVEAVDAASGFDGLLGHRLDVAGTAFEPALTAHEAMALEDVGKAAAWPEPMPALRGVVAPFAVWLSRTDTLGGDATRPSVTWTASRPPSADFALLLLEIPVGASHAVRWTFVTPPRPGTARVPAIPPDLLPPGTPRLQAISLTEATSIDSYDAARGQLATLRLPPSATNEVRGSVVIYPAPR